MGKAAETYIPAPYLAAPPPVFSSYKGFKFRMWRKYGLILVCLFPSLRWRCAPADCISIRHRGIGSSLMRAAEAVAPRRRRVNGVKSGNERKLKQVTAIITLGSLVPNPEVPNPKPWCF